MDEIDFSNVQRNLIEIDPQFWNLYNQYKLDIYIYDIIYRNMDYFSMFKFLLDYPELTSFYFRSLYFKNCMRKKLNQNNNIILRVNWSRILADSFQQLNYKSHDEWLNNIRVNFIGEYRIDAGGLIKE